MGSYSGLLGPRKNSSAIILWTTWVYPGLDIDFPFQKDFP